MRERLAREMRTVETPVGPIRFKVATRDGRVLNAAPEFEDCARAAAERGMSIKDVQAMAVRDLGGWLGCAGVERLSMARFYLTTAIDYVNSRPHLGTAYEKIAADVIARYKRLAGFETHFVMGNDEHSQNVFKKAQRARGWIRWPTATRWSRSSAGRGPASTSRSTTSSGRRSRATVPA